MTHLWKKMLLDTCLFYAATNSPDLDFWWGLLCVSKPKCQWAVLFALGRGIHDVHSRDSPLVWHLPTFWWPAWKPVTFPIFQQIKDTEFNRETSRIGHIYVVNLLFLPSIISYTHLNIHSYFSEDSIVAWWSAFLRDRVFVLRLVWAQYRPVNNRAVFFNENLFLWKLFTLRT